MHVSIESVLSEEEVDSDPSEYEVGCLACDGQHDPAETHRVQYGNDAENEDERVEDEGRGDPGEDVIGREKGQGQVDPPGNRRRLNVVVLSHRLLQHEIDILLELVTHTIQVFLS
jgi:hypothetical protein